MGEAKRRGTFMERVQMSKEKNKRLQKIQDRIKEPFVLPPKFIIFEIATSTDGLQSAVLLTDKKHNCVLDQMLFPVEMMKMDNQRCVRVFQTALKVDHVF